MNSHSLRASDADREHTVSALQGAAGSGRLTLDEFSERAAAAYAARTVDELAVLTDDLPPPRRDRGAPDRIPVLVVFALMLTVVLLTFALGPVAAAMGELAWCH